jgi:hypothetical protein
MASVVVIIGNGFFFASQVESGPGVASQPISERVLLGILGTLAALIILPFVAVVFRYRWHTIDGLPLHRRVAAKVAPAPAKAAAWPMRTKRAGLLLSQIRLAFAHSASWLNIAFGLIAMWMSYCLVMPNREMMVFSPGLTPLLFFSVFAASMAFAGDNRNGFLMFLSDRGASPALVYWSRLLPATAYVMLPLMFVLCVTFSNAHGIRSTQPSAVAFFFYSQIVAAAAVLSLCFYSSICHSRPILSFAVAAIATLIGVLLAGGVVELSGTLANPVGLGWSTDWLLMHTIGWGWLCPLILFVAAWRSTKHRLLRGHATPAVAYPWWTALAFCAPVFMAASTAFLFLPKASAPVSVEQALTDAMVLPAPFASSDSSAFTLEELQSSLQRPAQVATPVQWVGRREEIRSAIESTTSIFHRAIEARDFEQAAHALKCHNALLSQMGTAMYAALQRSSRTAVEIYFDYEDLEKMSKFVPAGELIANTSVQQAQALQEQQRVIYLAVLSGRLDADQLPPSPGFSANQFSWNPTLRTLAHYPPIRWRLEREFYASR